MASGASAPLTVVVALLVMGGATTFVAGAGPFEFSRHRPPATECRVLADAALTLSSVPVGTTLAPTLRAGVREGFRLGPLVSVEFEDDEFETPWYVVVAIVIDVDGNELGAASWLSPDAVATLNPEAGVTAEVFAASPAGNPQATYLWSANELARRVSVWPPRVSIWPLPKSVAWARSTAEECAKNGLHEPQAPGGL